MRIVVFGASGFVGQKILDLLKKTDIEVYAFVRDKTKVKSYSNVKLFEFDINNTQSYYSILNKIKPDSIINAIAASNVDWCETNEEEAMHLNKTFVDDLICISKQIDSHLVHVSTDFIFDGKEGSYQEDSKVSPVNYYGFTKLLAEETIIRSGVSNSIFRVILIYGKNSNMHKSNFPLWVKDSLEQGKEITVVDDQMRSPTFVDDIAQVCISASKNKYKGIFNISSEEVLSVYDFALLVADYLELDKSLIKPISTSDLNLAAKRPLKTGFIISKAKEEINFVPTPLLKSLDLIFKQSL